MKRRHPETQIQKSVLQHLSLRGAPGVFAFHPANGGWRSPIEAAILVGMGVVPGVPDIILIKDGQTFGLELKATSGRLTPTQVDTHKRMRAAGAIIGTAVGIDQALAWLEGHKLLRGQVTP